ncbi:MAG: ABC transporter permease [Rikenellaceae bacterium]|nr:ABC transporter permease [Rikenellaceae bacterium]
MIGWKNDIWIGRKVTVGSDDKSAIMIKVASITVAVSMAVMVVSVAVIMGFKHEISSKIAGFEGHIHIVNLDNNRSYEKKPIATLDKSIADKIRSLPNVKSISCYGYKPGLLLGNNDMHGMVLKGVDADADLSFFSRTLTRGRLPENGAERSKEIIVSQQMADALLLDTGRHVEAIFVQDPPRRDRFVVCGIYDSSLAEFDELMVLTDIRNVRRLNNWGDSLSSGYEITLRDHTLLDKTKAEVETIVFDTDRMLMVTDYIERNTAIFDWLDLQDTNGVVIITIMLIVACFNMAAMMLMIMARSTRFIGIMKTLGSRNVSLQRIFIYRASTIALKGIVWGDIAAIVLLAIQKITGIVKLDSTGYFISSVPVELNVWHIMLLSLGSYIVIIITQIIPTMIVSGFSPAESMKYKE